MKQFKILIALAFLSSVLSIQCSKLGGTDPVGVTGGSDSGYGIFNDIWRTGSGSGNGSGVNPNLVGSWRHEYAGDDYETITFYSNGSFQISYFQEGFSGTIDGTYSVSGNQITLYIEGETIIITYSLSGDELTLFLQGEGSVVYYRI